MYNLPSPVVPGPGHNTDQVLKDAGALGRKAAKDYAKHNAAAGRSAAQAQVDLIVLGKAIHIGREACGGNTKQFGIWLMHNKFDQIFPKSGQMELNACLHMYIHVELNKDVVLTDCRDTIPTNIMKWIRRHNGHLFEKRPTKKRTHTLLDSIIEEIRNAPIDLGTKLREAMKNEKELAIFKRALQGRTE